MAIAHADTLPGMQAVAKLNDGDPETVAIWCPGGEGGGEVAVRFPQPVEVTVLRLVVLYVNFRQSDTYIRSRFLYPLDRYLEGEAGATVAEGHVLSNEEYVAALVIAAIPTFLVFVFCQNIIMRGIVVPTEK